MLEKFYETSFNVSRKKENSSENILILSVQTHLETVAYCLAVEALPPGVAFRYIQNKSKYVTQKAFTVLLVSTKT